MLADSEPEWRKFADACKAQGIAVFADESVADASDVILLAVFCCSAFSPLQHKPFVHGVNVKLEKAGGYRGAVLALSAAISMGLQVSSIPQGSDHAAVDWHNGG